MTDHVRSRGRVPFDETARMRHCDGNWILLRKRGQVTEWKEDGKPHRAVGIYSRVDDAIEARTRAEIIYSTGGIGIWDWIRTDGYEEYWSPQFHALLGYKVGEIEPSRTSFRALLHPDDADRTGAMIQEHFAGEAAFDIQYRLRCKSGQYRWFHGLGTAIFDAEGKPTRMVGSIQDIHDRKLIEEQLTVLHRRHAISLKASMIGIWDWDVEANLLVWDEQMYALYGIKSDTFSSAYEAWLHGVHPDDRNASDTQVQRALSGEENFDTEFRVVWPSGEVRSIRAIGSVVRDDQNRPTHMIGANWDITEQNRIRDALQRSNEDLTQFAYRTSHDFKAPLRTIQGLAQMMSQDLADGDYAEVEANIGKIQRHSNRLETLVNDILSLARSELQDTELENASIESLLDDVTSQLAESWPDQPVQIRTKIEGDFDAPLPKVRLAQIILNLASNSIKYRHPDRSDPFVEIQVYDRANHIGVQIADNGLGIPAAFHDQMFRMFKRFHTEVDHGSGLGASIVKRHIDQLGGQIQFDSSPDGTRFDLTIPYRQETQ